MEDDGKSYKIINGAYACTKTLISRLFLVEKEKNHMMCEICSKRPFKCDQPEFCSLSCLEIRVNRNKCFCKKKKSRTFGYLSTFTYVLAKVPIHGRGYDSLV